MNQKIWALITLVLAAACAWLYLGRPQDPPAATPPSVQAPQAPDPLSESPVSSATETPHELNGLRLRLAAAEHDRDEYKKGLEAAVAELNRLNHEKRVAERVTSIVGSAGPAPALPSRTSPARVSSLRAPTVQVLGQEILVTGMLYNSGDEPAYVTATVTLLLNNSRIDTASFPLTVPARSDASYSKAFRFPGTQGTYSATVAF